MHERLGDIFRGTSYIFMEEGGEMQNLMSNKKWSSEILADEKTFFRGKVTRQNVTCEIFLHSLKIILN